MKYLHGSPDSSESPLKVGPDKFGFSSPLSGEHYILRYDRTKESIFISRVLNLWKGKYVGGLESDLLVIPLVAFQSWEEVSVWISFFCQRWEETP